MKNDNGQGMHKLFDGQIVDATDAAEHPLQQGPAHQERTRQTLASIGQTLPDHTGGHILSGLALPGRLGQAKSTSGTTLTLYSKHDAVNFAPFVTGEPLVVVASPNNGEENDTSSAGLRAGSVTVQSYDEDAGTVEATANWTSGIGALSIGDWLYIQGFYGDDCIAVINHKLTYAPRGFEIMRAVGSRPPRIIERLPSRLRERAIRITLRSMERSTVDLRFW